MIKSFFAFAFFSVLISTSANAAPIGFRQAEASKNLSQFIRSNANHYWSYMKVEAERPEYQNFVKHQGFLTGDPHMGNFAPIPLSSKSGERQMHFVNIDFDDAGVGPFIMDFARYVITVEATFSKVKKKELEAAYIQGLQGHRLQPPKEIQEFLDMKVADYDKQATAYMRKNSNAKGFILESGKLEKDEGKIPRSAIAAVFPKMKLIDVATRPRERGGSEGTRLWTLVEDADGKRHIIELKPWEPSGLSEFQQQPALDLWAKSVYETFWPGLNTSDYDLIEMKGYGYFWKRPKKFSLIDELKDEFKTANELAIFDANVLGLIHGGQKQSAPYTSAVQYYRQEFHEVVEAMVDDYLSYAKRAFEKAKK